jgi:D-alanyl-D-alanine endopeptidase (penicillin-binding protein 7)
MSHPTPSRSCRISALLAVILAAGLAGGPAEAAPKRQHARRAAPELVTLDGRLEPRLGSSAVLVREEGNLDPLLARQADVASPIASITKLMTALVVLEGGQPLDEVIQLAPEDGALERSSASRLRTGVLLTRADLLHLALMSSENRAAHALGRNYPGGLPAFVQAMNAKATQLGMHNARFVEPTGLSSNNVASPADLALLVEAAAREPLIREYSTDGSHEVRVGRQRLQFHNTDALVHNPAWDIVVQKTGYISEAGRCLVLKAVIRGRAVVMVLLDSFGKNTRVADAARIRKWLEAKLAEVPRQGSPPA